MTKNKKYIAIAVSLSLAASMLFADVVKLIRQITIFPSRQIISSPKENLLFTMPELIQSSSKQKGICLYPIMIMENWYVP